MARSAFPYNIIASAWRDGHNVHEPSAAMPGMSIEHYFLGQILCGLAMNPVTMLNIEEHLDYAIRLSELAARKTDSMWPC